MKVIYDVIKRPLFTEKGMDIKERENKILIEVHREANKHEIRRAMEEIFKVPPTASARSLPASSGRCS